MTDAEKFEAWRKARDFSQAEAADFCKISIRTVIRIESGATAIKPAVLAKMDGEKARGRPPKDNLPPPIKSGERANLPRVATVEKTMPDGSVFVADATEDSQLVKLAKESGVRPLIDVPPDDGEPHYEGQIHSKLPAPRDLGPALRAVMRDKSITSLMDRVAGKEVIKQAERERLSMIEVHPDGFRVPSNLLGLTAKGLPCFSRTIHDPPIVNVQGAIIRESHVYRARSGEGSHSVKLIGTPAKIPLPSEPGFYPIPAGAYSPVNYAAGANTPHAAQKAGETKRRKTESADA